MKKIAIGFLIFFVVLVAAAALVPIFFKKKIIVALNKEIEKNIDAQVIYKSDDVSLSLLRGFPNMSLKVENLSVIGKDSFLTDTLAQIPSFGIGLNLMSVITGDELKINKITLDEPVIRLVVLKSGKANWDIMLPDTAAAATDTATSDFRLAIKQWTVNNGTLFYDDLSMPMGLSAYNVNHTGSGDFEQNVFDMESKTTAERFLFTYDGVNYIQNANLDADVTMAMDLDRSLYTFKENNIRLNELPFQFAGTILMPEDAIDFDLTFEAAETEFRNVLSVVPGMYTEQFKDIQTDGKLSFNGYYKGRMSDADSLMPGYGTELKIVEGMFKYPDLPQAARNINLDMRVDNKDGTDENLLVDIKQLHLDLGKNPVDARVLVQGLGTMQVDGNVKATVDLDEMTKVFPVEGIALRGLLQVDANAKGTYSETRMPVMEADMRLANGYVKSKDFPAPIQNLNMVTNILNKTGNTNDTRINVERFNMSLDGEPLEGRVLVQGIDQPAFDGQIKGILDLTKLTKIFPLENMTVSGRINANVAAKGKMSDIEAERYNNVQANGTMEVANLNFVSQDLPQGIKINSANAVFTNERVQLQNLSGFLGKSDIQASGTISNYIGYALAENQPLRGDINLSSNTFDVNEWMVDENTGEPVAEEQQGVVEVPANLDIALTVDARQVLYDNLKLNNVNGRLQLKDQVARLQQISFNTLGGSFVTSGSYNTKNLQKPVFDFALDVRDLEFKQAFNAFNTIRAVAPIAGLLDGKFSTKFNFAGDIGQDMTPIFKTLDGRGIIEVVRATVKDVPIVDKISSLTNFEELKTFIIENKKIDAEIVNGSLVIKPFDLKVGNVNMTVGGTNNVNGNIDYATALNVPAGKVGRELNTRLANLIGNNQLQGSDRITLNLNIGGTLSDPRVALAGGSAKAQATELVKNAVQSKVDEAKAELDQRKQQVEDSVRAELDRRKSEAEQKIQAEIERKRLEAENQIKKQATDRIGDLLRPRSKPAAAPDTTKTGNEN